MNHYSDLIKAVDSANVALARSIIIGYANQSVEKLTGALDIINSRALSIFVRNEETLYPINTDVTSWDGDYWHGLTSDLMHNFSKERLEHLLEVAKILKPELVSTRSQDIRLDAAIKQVLDKLIQGANLGRLRSELVGRLNVSSHKALKAFIYTVEQKPEVLQDHDENLYPIDRDENSWDKNYWNGLTSDMMHNFSKERFEHAVKVAQYLDKANNQDTIHQKENVHQHEYDDRPNESTERHDNNLTFILIAAGIVIAVPVVLWLLFKS